MKLWVLEHRGIEQSMVLARVGSDPGRDPARDFVAIRGEQLGCHRRAAVPHGLVERQLVAHADRAARCARDQGAYFGHQIDLPVDQIHCPREPCNRERLAGHRLDRGECLLHLREAQLEPRLIGQFGPAVTSEAPPARAGRRLGRSPEVELERDARDAVLARPQLGHTQLALRARRSEDEGGLWQAAPGCLRRFHRRRESEREEVRAGVAATLENPAEVGRLPLGNDHEVPRIDDEHGDVHDA